MKLGIIGSGMIVKDFLSFAHELPEIKLEAIAARNIENLKELQSKYNIKNIYTDIDLCLENKEIDTIYVAVPNNLHYEVAKKALEAGKNVICEKPFTLKYDEAVELFEIAEARGLILIEAITNQYQKNYLDIKDNIDNIGEIRLVECNFSQLSSRYEAFKNGVIAPVFDKSKGGGVLGDLNIYNIHFVVGLFGKPNKVHYSPNIVNDVDTSGILLLEYNNFKVVCIAAKDTFNNSYVNIQGDQGIIKVIGPTNEVPNYSIQTKDNLINENKNIHSHRMFAEFKKFVEVINNKDFKFMNDQKEHTLNVMYIYEEAKKFIDN
ncbi:Gfo/Idh/MocA family oxidoreductase [uncultured Gemella sp.]|uniref:Gfo/Idh/MocA family protein n=1 Tax=uncultured Gemella sp. TaxID=254352 RepID=UPI00261E0D82|nr:Gfo/Idh/MocA family oxidoreductase [uncultured Gemella sp.]